MRVSPYEHLDVWQKYGRSTHQQDQTDFLLYQGKKVYLLLFRLYLI